MMSKTAPAPTTAVVAATTVWWAANVITTIASKQFMQNGNAGASSSGLTQAFTDLRWVELTALQHLVGAVLVGVWIKLKRGSLFPVKAQSYRQLLMAVALGNVVGSAGLNAAFSLIASSSVLVVMACEPLFSFALGVVLFSNYDSFNLSTVLSLMVIIAGVVGFLLGDITFNIMGLVAALIASVAFPLHHILLKKLSGIWDSVLQKFAVVSVYSLAFMTPVVLVKLAITRSFSTGQISDGMLSSFFHSAYNLGSLAVVEAINPMTFAILDTVRRLIVIMANILYFNAPFYAGMLVSLLMILLGYYLYQQRNNSNSKFTMAKCVLLALFLVFLFSPYYGSSFVGPRTLPVHSTHHPVLHDTHAKDDSVLKPAAMSTPRLASAVPAAPARPEAPDVPEAPARPKPPDVPEPPARPKPPAVPVAPAVATPSTLGCPRMNQISTAWIYYESVPAEAVNNIRALADSNPGTPVRVYCGTSQCMDVISALNNDRITPEFAVLPEIFKDTPLATWLALNPIHKVLAGKDFQTHVQEATVLSLLLKHGGFYVSPLVHLTSRLDFPKCKDGKEISWVSRATDTAKRIFDAAYFPKNDAFLVELAKLFSEMYPTLVERNQQFRFNFRTKAWSMVNSSCPTCPETKRDVRFEGDVVSVETELSQNQHFATLSYDSRIPHIGLANLGDEIQGFPGMQFVPFVDRFVQRDTITGFKSKGNVSMFFNAWWGSEKASWPPPSNIDPVMLSIHIAPPRMGVKWAEHIGWARDHDPIGCRDSDTLKFLHQHQVKAFFTGCMTLFMKNPYLKPERTKNIFFVDLKSDLISLLPQHIRERGIKVWHNLKNPRQSYNELRFVEAYKLIQKYGGASVVVTQRIHCALPCVAMGTTVIFINSAGLPGGGGSSKTASGRTSGLTPLFHTVNLYDMSRTAARKWLADFPWDNPPPNPEVSMTMRLRATSWNVIRKHPIYYDGGRRYGIIPMSPPTTKIAGKTFVFHLVFTTSSETAVGTLGNGEKRYGAFTWRHWRSVESILYHHPTSEVIVHSNTLPPDTFDVLTEVGYSIRVQKYSLPDLLRGSPVEKFSSKLESAKQGSYWHVHETELVSLLMLHQQGGVYVSSDVILVRPIDPIPANSLGPGMQTSDSLSDAFLFFEKGNEFLSRVLSAFADQYDANNLAGTQRILKTTQDTFGQSVSILPSSDFYTVSSDDVIQQFFEDTSGVTFEANQKVIHSEAYGVYLNSAVTGHLGIGDSKLKEGTIGRELLTAYCVLCSNLH